MNLNIKLILNGDTIVVAQTSLRSFSMSNTNLLTIQNLSVSIDDTPVISDLTLSLDKGCVSLIMGQNGSGKSSLARTLLGDPTCIVNSGSITYQEQDLLALSIEQRAQRGIFLAFQNPCILPGVPVFTLLHEAYKALGKSMSSVHEFKALLLSYMKLLALDAHFLDRNVNEGFSGGEKKKLELLQLLVFRPSCIILDEIDSGLDIDALKLIATTISLLKADNPLVTVIIITHNPSILEVHLVDTVHIMAHGKITHSGTHQLLIHLTEKGYNAFI